MRVRALEDRDRPWLRDLIAEAWSLPVVTPTGSYDDPTAFDGFVADVKGELVGAVTYRPDGGDRWEVVTLNALLRRSGVATALMGAVREQADASGVGTVWLITTDDNPGAIAFYEQLGMRRARTIAHFVEVVARHKPAVSGAFRDAIEFEWIV